MPSLAKSEWRLFVGIGVASALILLSQSFRSSWYVNAGSISLLKDWANKSAFKSRDYLQECLNANPSQSSANLNSLTADEYLQMALSVSSHNVAAYRLLGTLGILYCDNRMARPMIETGLQMMPDDPLLLFSLGLIEYKEDHNTSAFAQWRKVKGVEIFFAALGDGFNAPDTEGRAMEYYVLSDRLAPQPDVRREWIYLRACTISESWRHLDEAKYWCEKRLSVHPDDFYALQGLGEIAFLQSRYAEAVAILRKAIQVQPDGHRAHALLGESYREQGQTCAALAELGVARQLQPGDPWYEGSYSTLSALGPSCNR